MIKTIKNISGATLALVALSILVFVPAASAAASTLTVTPTNTQGFALNRDSTAPFEFNKDKASIGEGSLYVKPIGATASEKFVAEKTFGTAINKFNSLSYDFLIAGDGVSADANQFYLNIYANLPGSTTFFDCRFDYVPTAGSTSAFTTAVATSTTIATAVRDRANDMYTCPTTLGQMAIDKPGSTIKFVAINVGNSSNSDTGLAGYLDNVIINNNGNQTTYDFEPTIKVSSKDACKKDGWMTSNTPEYKNQGDCVSSFASKNKSDNNSIINRVLNLF